MIILGLDPGTMITGYGFVVANADRVSVKEVGVIKPPSSLPLHQRIKRIYQTLESLVSQYQPDVAVLEKLYAHHKHPATAPIIAHARGVICLLCAQKDIELAEYSVKRIRQSVTGNGNATKIQTREFVCSQMRLDPKSLTLDASDALALALGHLNMGSGKVIGG